MNDDFLISKKVTKENFKTKYGEYIIYLGFFFPQGKKKKKNFKKKKITF